MKDIPKFPYIPELEQAADNFLVLQAKEHHKHINRQWNIRLLTILQGHFEVLVCSYTLLSMRFIKEYEKILPLTESFQNLETVNQQEKDVIQWIKDFWFPEGLQPPVITDVNKMYQEMRLKLTVIPYRIKALESIIEETKSLKGTGDLYAETPRAIQFMELADRFHSTASDIIDALDFFAHVQKIELPKLKILIISTTMTHHLLSDIFSWAMKKRQP